MLAIPGALFFFGLGTWKWGQVKQVFTELDFTMALLLMKLPVDLADLFARALGLEGSHLALAFALGMICRGLKVVARGARAMFRCTYTVVLIAIFGISWLFGRARLQPTAAIQLHDQQIRAATSSQPDVESASTCLIEYNHES